MDPTWSAYLIPGLLIATRWSGMMLVAPFFGSEGIPARVKASLVIALTVVAWPVTPHALGDRALLAWMGAGLSELMIGLLLGISVLIAMEAVQMAGTLVGFQMGLSLESAIDPSTQADSTVLATLHQIVALYLFLALGMHRWMLQAMIASFIRLPLGSALASSNAHDLLTLAGYIFSWGVQMALPLILLTLILDLTLGFVAKVAPQMPVLFIGIPVKLLCGYAVLIATVHFWPGIVTHEVRDTLTFFMNRIHA